VASHPQALAQCRGWLDRNLAGVERLETSSTAAAAELAAREAGTAAIVNPFLAEECGLASVASAIEDRRDNTTRFLVLGGAAPPPSGNDLTMLAYTVRKAESGALHRLLEPFSHLGVNLTSIQARPLKGAPWEYVFFLDLEGHQSEPRVREAVEAAGRAANSFRVLGSFPRAREARSEGGGR
jgi:chorismate mutase/prephenate dehydratase